MRPSKIVALGAKHGYKVRRVDPRARVIIFDRGRDDVQINVFFTTMTIATILSHPIYGRTQLFRRNVTPDQLDKILENPRAHTGIGYRRAPKKV